MDILISISAELSKPGMVRPSKSDSRHLIRRACFNLPKFLPTTTAQSLSSINSAHQSNSPASQSSTLTQNYTLTDTFMSAISTHRKTDLRDHLPFNASQPKEVPPRGISPHLIHHTTTDIIYNPSVIKKL